MSEQNQKKKFVEGPKVDQESGRVYNGVGIIESDLFRLKLANAMKNIALPDSGQIDLEKVEHSHFWRTYDSDGKLMKYCAPVAGHFHEITFQEDPNGGPVKVVKVSGPMRMGQQRIRGQMRAVPIPVSEELEDNHVHETEYLKSHKVEARVTNVRAMQFIGEEAAKASSIPGVQG